MAAFDPSTAALAPGEFDPATATPWTPPPTSALGEIGTAALRGVISSAPAAIGKTMQFFGMPEAGAAVRQWGEQAGAQPWLQAQPEGHSTAVNTLAGAAEGVGSFAAPIALGALNPLAGLAATGAQMAGTSGEETLEKAQAKGVAPDVARTAANLNAAQSFAFGVAGGAVGGKMLGMLGGPIGRVLGLEGAPLAEDVMAQMAGTSGVLKPFLKQLPTSAAEGAGVMLGQAGVQAGIEQHYGIDDTDPLTAMGQQIGPALGLAVVMSPLGLAGRALGVRSAKARTDTLASADTAPEIRAQLADQYTAALAKVDPAKAAAFRANADTAITDRQGLPVDPTLFTPGVVQPSPQAGPRAPESFYGPAAAAPAAPEAPQLAGSGGHVLADTEGNLYHAPVGQVFNFPDNSSSSDIGRAQSYINGLPVEQRAAAWRQLTGQEAPAPEAAAPAAPGTPLLAHEQYPQLPFNPTPWAVTPEGQAARPGVTYNFPDGSSTNDLARVNSYISGRPEAERPAAWAQLLGLEAPPAASTKEVAAHAQDVLDLHEQVRGALTEAGVEPAQPMDRAAFGAAQGIKGAELAKAYKAYLADPATKESLMRQDADRYQQMLAEREAAPAPDLNRQVNEQTPAERANTQLADAMQRAVRQKQIDDAYSAYDAQRAHEADIIANRTKGEQLATAAEQGKVQPDVNAPKALDEITRDADAIKQAAEGASGPAMRSFDARVKALNLDALGSHAEQIEALRNAAENGKMSVDVASMMTKLADTWKAEAPKVEQPKAAPEPAAREVAREVPKEAKPAAAGIAAEQPAAAKTALGENIPPSAPDTTAQPAASARAQEALPDNTSKTPRQRAVGLVDRINAVLAEFHDRDHGGEKIRDMTPLEQQRYKDAVDYRRSLSEIAQGKSRAPGEEWWRDMQGFVDQVERPYLKDPLEKQGTPDMQPTLRDRVAKNGPLSDTLAHIAQNGSTPEVRAVAARLNELGLDTALHSNFIETRVDPVTGARVTTSGRYNPALDRIEINQGHESEETVLHEATHAGLMTTIARALRIGTPRNQREAQLKQALRDWEDIRKAALKTTTADPKTGQYGLTNAQEFGAELMSNPKFQEFLKSQGTQKSLWDRAVDAVRRMFGMKVDERGALEKAMSAADVVFDEAKAAHQFDASPEGAARATDEVLYKLADTADRVADRVHFGAIARDVFQKMLGWKTVDFIAHGADQMPELVQSGFSKALNSYREARDARRVLSEHLSDQLGGYVKRTQQALRATGDPRGWGEKLTRIGSEASIHGFDYKKNFADNKRDNKELDDSLKSYVDDIHRQYTQLKSAQPQLAKLLVEGEQQNRKTLIQTVATLAHNKLQAATGIAPRLEAELLRMPVDDANRARMESRVQGAKMEGELANAHMNGLDIMGAGLKTARNGLPDFHLDGASAALGARLDAMFKGTRDLPADSPLRVQMAELERMYRAQLQNPYFSLGRSGDHFVNIAFKPGMDAQTQAKLQAALTGTNKVLGDLRGQTHAFFRVDTFDQAVGLKKKLIEAGGADRIDVNGSSAGKLADFRMQSAAGITPALRQLGESLHDLVDDASLTAEQAAAMRQTLTRTLMGLLPETAARSAKMQRRGVPGYDADFVGGFARRASGVVQDLSNTYANRRFSASIKDMKDSVEGLNHTSTTDAGVRAQMIADEINRRYSNSMQPLDTSHISLLNSLGHTFYLAASPAFYIRTMAQPWHRGLPILAAKYGAVNSAKEIGGATSVAMKVVGNTIRNGWAEGGVRGVLDNSMQFKGLGLSARDEAFMQEAHDRGILKLGQAQQLQHAITGGSQVQQDIARMASMTAQYAEMTNRMVVGLAAFRLASRDPKMSPQGATEYAIKAINNAMDNFDPDNTARQIGKHGFAGKVTPLMTSFMNYQLQTMQQIVRTVHDGYFSNGALPGETPEGFAARKSQARKEFGGLMLTTAMISGVLGLPFANALAGVYNWLTKDNNDPSDVRDEIRGYLTRTLGTGLGGFLAHGIGHAVNMDTSTFGLENILPGSEFLADRRLMQDRIESQSQQLMGPALNAGVDIALGLSKISDGYVIKGIEHMLPSGLKPYFKAAELAGAIGPGGYTDSRGNPIPMQHGTWDTMLQAVGFRTAEKAERDDVAHEFGLNQQLLQHRRQVIGDQFVKAAQPGNANRAADMTAATQAMMAFNRENPLQPIRGPAEAIRNHMMANAVGGFAGLGVPVMPRQLPVLLKQFGYAAMPQGE